ncbi:hypothetical protein NliqN6_3274 [Naganishia liquefaciens]|uniref:BolA family transcriptional regulator n=1 Tax=Naganishia liquefaciens TaxID=104408 RepID=A0A8H3TTH4_9TREE|nr:hypothetical protein NliqN6_3274 [Naganishia liquefaciens]
MQHPGPVEISMHRKLTENLKPTYIKIQNDSSKHAHHSAMRAQGGGNGETHFTVILASPEFAGKSAIARHRLVNTLLKEEFEQMGLHALSLRLKTPTEADKEGLVPEQP